MDNLLASFFRYETMTADDKRLHKAERIKVFRQAEPRVPLGIRANIKHAAYRLAPSKLNTNRRAAERIERLLIIS